jgi:hypothetical protein
MAASIRYAIALWIPILRKARRILAGPNPKLSNLPSHGTQEWRKSMNVKKLCFSWLTLVALVTLFIASPQRSWSATTATTLTATSGGSAVTTVPVGSVVTLTASVTISPGSTAVRTGQVNFCDAAATYCTDIHVLGTAQLTSTGKAVIKLVPGVGNQSYQAVFLGTTSNTSSASADSLLTVTGKYPTSSTIVQSGVVGSYSLTATVAGNGLTSPSGTVSFLDSNNGNSVLGSASLFSATSGLSFLNTQSPATGAEPIAVATADFNGDGKVDLAVVNRIDGTVTIFLGNGDGTFTAHGTPVAVGNDPAAIAVGDFNKDGKPDLAVANSADDTVTILRGNGDGTFTALPSLATGSNPDAVVAADFDNDGILDLAIANRSDNTVTVWIGQGDGTFTESTTTPTGNTPVAIAASDFNGDGKLDLVVANNSDNTLTVLLGHADGTFTPTTAHPATGGSPQFVLVADFNNDGAADLAVANSGDNTVTVLLGNGAGAFTLAATVPTGGMPYSLAAADFDKTGTVDLAVANFNDSTVSVLLGNGDGTFSSSTALPASGTNPGALAVADFNGDGYADIVTADLGGNTVTVLLSESQTSTAAATGISVSGLGPHLADASYPGDGSFSASVSGATPLYAPAPAPVIALAPGTYTTVQSVGITDAISGAAIYYTTDGTTPTNSSTLYTVPFSASVSETVQAIAVATGYAPSNVASASYTINLPAAAVPVISLASGTYASAQSVTITDTTPGATIYYTTNGSTPTTASSVYSGSAITVSSSETLAASAIAFGYSMSGTASAQYIIGSAPASLIYSIAGNGNAGYDGDGAAATIADLNLPAASVLDASGNLYIADSYNNRVRKIAAGSGVITTIAGTGISGYSGDGTAAINAQLNWPTALALDSAGNLYVADSYNFVVRKVNTATGVITTYAGNGTQGYGGDSGPATSAQLNIVDGIALDAAGNLYVADSGNNLIRMVAASTKIISSVAGNGTPGYTGDNGLATAAQLYNPEGVWVDSANNLYIADSNNNVVRMVAAGTGVITTIAGDPTGNSGYSGDGGLATSATLYSPQAITGDASGNLFIADSHNSSIRRVDASTKNISTVAGNGNVCNPISGDGGPATSAGLCYPTGITVDGAGNLYVADSYNERVRKVVVSSLPPATLTAAPVFAASAGTYPSPQTVTISDTTPGASIYITMDGTTPTSLSPGYFGAIDVSGTVTVKAIAIAPGNLQSPPVSAAYTITSPPTAVISTVAGDGAYGFNGAGIVATSADLGYPQGVAVDASGNLFITDTGNNVVWKVTSATGLITPVAGNGTAGYTGDGALAVNAQLNYPSAVALDSAGNLYIADATNNAIRLVTASTGVITTFAGTGLPGYSGDSGLATAAELYDPTGVALDSLGNLYIADSGNSAIRVVTASTGVIATIAGTGAYSDSGDGGLATSAGIQQPIGVAFDSTGNLFIAEENGRIRKVTASTGVIATVAGDGDPGYSGDGGQAINAEISEPSLALDPAGNLYISNWPAAVREVSATTGAITTIAGNGLWGFIGDGGSAPVAELAGPAGIALDAAGNLYIADSNNYRVRKVTFPPPTPTPVFTLAAGTYINTRTTTITDSIVGATIYYTTDGTTPTTASSVYSGQLTISASETLEAIAVATGYTESAPASAVYTIVPPSTPAITWPAPSAIVYGTALSATQLDATTTVPGTFVYSPALGSVLGAGPQTLSVTFTPTDSVSYTIATGTVQITVNPAVLTVTAANATRAYGVANPAFTASITGFVNGDTQSVVTGSASLTTTATTASVVGPYPITAAAGTLSAANYSFTFVPGTLTVTQASTNLTWGAPAAITYGTALSAAQLNATSGGVAGNFVYSPLASTVLTSGPHTLSVTFTPTDTVDYAGASTTVQITVNPAVLTVTAANASRVYGVANPSLTFSIAGFVNGDTQSVVTGLASVTTTATTASAVGPYPITAAAGTLSAVNYTFSFVPGTLTVTQATPSLTWGAPAAIAYGTALGATQLNATSGGVAGSFVYTPATGSVLGAGAHTLSVTFTPTDAVDYTSPTSTVQITVNPAVLMVTAANATRIYGAANPTFTSAIAGFVNGDTQTVVTGSPSLTTAATTSSVVGSYPITAAAGTLSAANYTFLYVPGTLTVTQASPSITWSTPAAIAYGTALSAVQLNATSGGVAGSFAYSPAAGTVLAAGSHTLSVTFTPTDTVDYSSATSTVQITVNPAVLTVTAANATRIYGAANPTFTSAIAGFVNGDTQTVVTGSPSLTTAATTSSVVGSYPITAAAGTLSAANYTFSFVPGTLTVTQASTSLTWAAPAAITFGMPLSSTQLNATSGGVAGSFAYSPAAGTVLAAGSHTLSVTFTPTDTADFASASTTVSLTVSKATPALVETPSATSITTAQALSVTVAVNSGSGNPVPTGSVTLSSGTYSSQQTLVSGSATFSVPAGALSVGSDALAASYTPDAPSAVDYTSATQSSVVSVNIPIGASIATVTATSSAATITDQQIDTVTVLVAGASGQATGTVTLSSGSYSSQKTVVGGSVSFTIPAGALIAGPNTLTAAYSGDATYAAASGTTTVTIAPFVLTAPAFSPINVGSSGTTTFTLSASSTYSGTVNMTCSLTGAPVGALSVPTCTVNPTPLTITPGGTGTTVLTVQTTAASTAGLARPQQNLWGLGGGGAVLAAVLMLGIPARRRRLMAMFAFLLIAFVSGVIGCGGSSSTSSTSTGGKSTPATTAGSYVFTVIGTDAANVKITNSTNITVTVQ